MAALFLYAAIIQGAIAAGATFLAAFGDQIGLLPVAAARVIAAGEAGSWPTVGYVVYLIAGVSGMVVTSLFYFFIEAVQGKGVRRRNKGICLRCDQNSSLGKRVRASSSFSVTLSTKSPARL